MTNYIHIFQKKRYKKSRGCFGGGFWWEFFGVYLIIIILHPWKFKMKQFSSDFQGWTQSIPCKFWVCLKIIFKG